MVKVKVIKRYNDMVLKKIHEKDTVFETNEKRAQYLVKQGMVEIIEETGNKAAEKGEREKNEK